MSELVLTLIACLAFALAVIFALIGIWTHSTESALTAGLFLVVGGLSLVASEDFK